MTLTERCFFGSVRKMSANGRSPSNVDPTIAQTTNECHRPLTKASNFKSRFRDYRGGNETETRKRRDGGIEGKARICGSWRAF